MRLRSSGTAAADIAAKPGLYVRCMPPRREQQFSRGALLVTARSGTSKPAADDGRVPAEADVRYRRADFSELHAYEARQAFIRNVMDGEASIDLADAAFQIAAEDDALVSHSSVKLPVHLYSKRLQRMAEDIARHKLTHMSLVGSDRDPHTVMQVVQKYLYTEQCFQLPLSNLSGALANSKVDHPGVWENARHAYLHETLITKKGIAAALAIVQADILQRLMKLGALDSVIRTDCSDFTRLPSYTVLPGMTRRMVTRADGSLLNTCTSDALIQILRHLKRAYWPFAWDSSQGLAEDSRGLGIGGGFEGAAKVALEGEADAAMQAIARTAKHRLERGIWTSPGAGDLRRAKAACERLVLVAAGNCPAERRDLAVILLHCGFIPQAYAELKAYASTDAYHNASGSEKELVNRLLNFMQEDAKLQVAAATLTIESALQETAPVVNNDKPIPLTW